jgi:FkbM family methyltransferase
MIARMEPVNAEFPFRVVYVVTSDGYDAYADMALVSMLSVRISNPGLGILAVCDEKSALALSGKEHRLLEVCDEMISVPTSDGEAVFRNRWIKTQLCRYVRGSVLYLDADTLVRGSLADLHHLVSELGAVANHNGATLSEQIWTEDRQVFEGMGWPSNFQAYLNSGFFFFKPCPRVHEFFAKWHELWLAGVSANGRLRDQPSFNSAIVLSGVKMKLLPSTFNAQLAKSWNCSSGAVVWHFYASEWKSGSPFSHLVNVANSLSLSRLHRLTWRALTAPAPWPNFGWFARRLAAGVDLRGTVRTEERLWLNGRRKAALRFALGKARQELTKRLLRLNGRGYWSARKTLGFPVRRNAEILYWLRRQPELPKGSKTGSFRFPWGNFEYVNALELRAQFEDIFVGRQYAFSTDTSSPVIIDCGGNVGLSAVWFKLNYPSCQLTVYEADPDLAEIVQANLKRAGFEDALVRSEAVWIANEAVRFSKTGNDSGRIVSESPTSCPAIDLSERLPDYVDLLKLDIEGAEFPVVSRLCQTGAIQRVRRLICEFHVWRDKTDDLLRTLSQLRASGMQFSMKAAAVPWIGMADTGAPFEAIKRNHVLMEVFAWRPTSLE